MNQNNTSPMPHMTLKEIEQAVHGVFSGDSCLLDQSVTGVFIDSRLVTSGCLFVPIRGARVDGHSFIPQVMEAGALCTLSEIELPDEDTPYIRVESTEQALQDLAAWYRINLNIPVIGITGSYGKTTAKEMVYAVLSERFNVLKTEGNFNNHIGLPLTIFRIRPEHEAAVIEMGISDFGEMTVLAQIAQPDIAMITTIGDCHLEQLGDRAGVYHAKSEMFDYMRTPDAPIILRSDDEILGGIDKIDGHAMYLYGMQEENRNAPNAAASHNDAWVSDIVTRGLDGTDCTLHLRGEQIAVHVPIPALHSLYHMMAASLIGDLLGMTSDEIARGITRVQTLAGHGNIIHTDRYVILDDCYNANPASMEAALETLENTDRRRVAILGDMGELGENERDLHYEVGAFAGAHAPDLMICVGQLARAIMHGYQDTPAGRNAADEERAVCYDRKEDLLSDLPELLLDGDAVLVKASHFMGFEEIVEKLQAF